MSEGRAFDSDVAESYDFSGALDLSCAVWLVRVARNVTSLLS